MRIRFKSKPVGCSFWLMFSIIFGFFLLLVFTPGKNLRTTSESLTWAFGCVILPFLGLTYLEILTKRMSIELSGSLASWSNKATVFGPLLITMLWTIAFVGIVLVQNKQRCDNVHAGGVLRQCTYTHKDFSNRDLHGTIFERSNLSYVNLSHANLQNSNLNTTDLSHTVLTGAQLDGATLIGADAHATTGLTRQQLDLAQDWHGLILEERVSIVAKLGAVCRGETLPSVVQYETTSNIFSPLVLLDSDGSENQLTYQLPRSWWPTRAETVRYVACITGEIEKTDYCRYTNCGSTEIRYKGIRISVVDVQTGASDIVELYGSYSCPREKKCRVGDTSTDHATSDLPDLTDVIQSLEERVHLTDPIATAITIP